VKFTDPIKGTPFAVIDFETTGFAGPDTHVVELAIVHGNFGSDDVRVAYASRVRPPVAIPASSTNVHGITDADVVGCPTWAEVAAPVAAALDGRLPIAYNAPADFLFRFVEELRLTAGVVPADWLERAAALWQAARWLDLLVVRKATKTRGRPGKLAEIAAEYGIALDAHGATGDALSTALLVRPLMRAAWSASAFTSSAGAPRRNRWGDDDDDDHEERDAQLETIADLLTWQRGAALYQEQDFANYLRRSGALNPPQSYHHILEGVAPPTWDTGPKATPCRDCEAPTLRSVGQGGGLIVVNADGTPHNCEVRDGR
jgi:DNA polymerase-3 subunit epsilon